MTQTKPIASPVVFSLVGVGRSDWAISWPYISVLAFQTHCGQKKNRQQNHNRQHIQFRLQILTLNFQLQLFSCPQRMRCPAFPFVLVCAKCDFLWNSRCAELSLCCLMPASAFCSAPSASILDLTSSQRAKLKSSPSLLFEFSFFARRAKKHLLLKMIFLLRCLKLKCL